MTWFENPLIARPVGVVVDAVDEEVVEGAAQAVDVERALARRAACRQIRGANVDAGRQKSQRGILAPVERQGSRLIAGDDLTALTGIGLQSRSFGGHADRFGDTRDAQVHVNALTGADVDFDADRSRAEAAQFRRDLVIAGPDGEELICAAPVGCLRRRHAGCDVEKRDRHAGQNGASRIAHGAEHGAGIKLREGGAGNQNSGAQQQAEYASHGHLMQRGIGLGRFTLTRGRVRQVNGT